MLIRYERCFKDVRIIGRKHNGNLPKPYKISIGNTDVFLKLRLSLMPVMGIGDSWNVPINGAGLLRV